MHSLEAATHRCFSHTSMTAGGTSWPTPTTCRYALITHVHAKQTLMRVHLLNRPLVEPLESQINDFEEAIEHLYDLRED
jgi:hypothetical protein